MRSSLTPLKSPNGVAETCHIVTLSLIAEEQKIELFMLKQINYALRQYLSSSLQIYGEEGKIRLEQPVPSVSTGAQIT